MKIRFSPTLELIPLILAFLFISSACAPRPGPPLFVPPTEAPQTAPLLLITATPPLTRVPTIVIPTMTPTVPCTDGLTFIKDVTIPDGTAVTAGQSIDKQWLVNNSGTCDWDSDYRLKLVNGPDLSAVHEQALFPARAGAQATLRIVFTAPGTSGEYKNEWRAFNSSGVQFGDPITIDVIVQ